MNETIKPPRYVPGMEKPLPDYSERLSRRSTTNETLLRARTALQHSDQKESRPTCNC